MKSKILSLVTELYNAFGVEFCTKNVYRVTAFVAMVYARIILENNKISNITSQYPSISNIYWEMNDLIDNKVKQKIEDIICEIIKEDSAYNVIANVYELLKKKTIKSAMALIGTDKNKIKGTDAIRQTQFFTDSYMTEFLLDKVFKIKGKEIINCAFVDPASGGGNMLLKAFDKLYVYFKKNTELKDNDIVDHILGNMIVGYDIDTQLSEIASFTLYVYASRISIPQKATHVYIFGSIPNDDKGFLANKMLSEEIYGMTFEEKINILKHQNISIVYLTNPPFMGKRDMDIKMKGFLQRAFPSCKGDLCFSFMYKILSKLSDGDMLAAVTQNGWLNLVTLKWLRYSLISNYHLYDCADLGSNAFENINGDKTNIVLCVFGKRNEKNNRETSRFYNLRNEKYADKVKVLINVVPTAEIDSKDFLKNTNYEYNYIFGGNDSTFEKTHIYKNFGKCMQGSSTGDNKTMVKYIWETNDPDWTLASKGGGFSKWTGLNYYKVKWGKKGELLKENKGSALRNENMMDKTQLVYSDTGTLGMNARLIQPGQVFMASGPGIMVKKGSVFCHLAFLNSRAATYLIKVLNPKFTLSAGYIGIIPVPSGVLDNIELKNKAKECVRLKKALLAHKIPNLEFTHQNYSPNDGDIDFIHEYMSEDLANQLLLFGYERKIDSIVLDAYHFTPNQIENYHKLTGGMYNSWKDEVVNMEILDDYIAKHININCMPISRKLNGFLVGTENLLEMMSFDYQIPAETLSDILIEHLQDLKKTRTIYMNDLLHRLILYLTGVSNLEKVGKQISVDIPWLDSTLKEKFPGFYQLLKVDANKLNRIIKVHHKKSFMNKPILISNE